MGAIPGLLAPPADGRARLAAWASLVALPAAGLVLLLAAPGTDVHWEHHPSHFWLVLATALTSAALALSTSGIALRRADARLFLVSLAFLAAAGFLALHALATPGVLLDKPNQGFVIATPVGLLLAAGCAAASASRLPPARAQAIIRHAHALRAGLIVVMVAWGAVSLASIPPLDDATPAERASGALIVPAVAALLLYAFAGWRYLAMALRSGSAILLAVASACVLLAEAMAAVAFARSWHASWWEWHLLMLAAFGAIAYSARREEAEERFRDLYLDDTAAGTREISVLFADLEGFTSFLPQLGLAAMLFVGGKQVIDGRITEGDFVAFYGYVLMLTSPMRMLGMALGMAQRAVASGQRVFELLDRSPRMTAAPDAGPLPAGGGRVELRGVSFGYDGGEPVLRDLDLDVAPGRTVALVGPTGSGKTSLVMLIPRLYDVDEGTVLVDGVDVRDVDPGALRREVAVVSDDAFLFSASLGENIAYARPDADERAVLAAAERAGLAELIDSLPDGLDTLVGERGLTLSGGQRQRVAIARALLAQPRILILDDATSSVDATTESQIKAALGEVMAGRTTFVIAHRLSTIALADEVVVLEDGEIAARGTHAELLEDSPLYREIAEKGLPDQVFLTRDDREREVAGL